MSAKFQRTARRDEKAFLSDQSKKIEENNRMGKTIALFKKTRDTNGTFHAKMSTIKDRNSMNLTEAKSEEELKSLLMKVKEESEKVGLKLKIQKMKIMASGLITLWQIHGETVETVADFIFGGSKITADGDRSHEIKDACSLEGKL